MVSRSFFGLHLISIISAMDIFGILRVCNAFHGIVARINEELNVTLGKTGDALQTC
jgi:hypothetical protein